MEVKEKAQRQTKAGRRKKSLAGLFLRYLILFGAGSLLIFAGVFEVLQLASIKGLVLPANYAEAWLSENLPVIQSSAIVEEEWLPSGCGYGVYGGAGDWLYGTFSEKEQETAWKQYEKGNIYDSKNKYLRFIERENGEVCIVRYMLKMRYSSEAWNEALPGPEFLMLFTDTVLVILNLFLISRGFAKRLRVRLGALSAATDKISQNDLSFEAAPSDIREIDEVMTSLEKMKDALGDSLQKQWDMENQKKQQLSALAHDIKTPLTLVIGNAELLLEGGLSGENEQSASCILKSAKQMEQYLESMRRLLSGKPGDGTVKEISCAQLEDAFCEMARQLSDVRQLPATFERTPCIGTVLCCKERLLRAWGNLLGNAVDFTDREKGIHVEIGPAQKDGVRYLMARVRDFGKGFSPKDLLYATEDFYSGDESRHDRGHQGLGLSIAGKFMQEQGGFLEYENAPDAPGAQVTLWVRVTFQGSGMRTGCAFRENMIQGAGEAVERSWKAID